MNIALIGYGKMGQIVEKTAKQRGNSIVSIIDPFAPGATHKDITRESLKKADICIDFTSPSAAIDNLRKVAALKKSFVMGTTGWYGHMEEARKIVKSSGIGFIWSGNFSIGVNMFFRIIENASKMIDKMDNYDIGVYEIHHKKKKDSPSGTAEMIGKILLDNIRRKDSLVYEKLDREIKQNEIHVASIRYGSVHGTHVVNFDSNEDIIELKHTARSRDGFAVGAVMAAEWLMGKKGFYNINDMMDKLLKI